MALEVRELSVYSSTKRIIDKISFSLERGEVALITGRSGAGKTTLLRSLVGVAKELYKLDVNGSVTVYGEKIRNSLEASKYFYYVVQEPWYSISSPYPILDIISKADTDINTVEDLAKRLGIHHKLFDSTTNLSAGEAQRVALLEALVSNKKVVLVDEITSYLDKESKQRVVDAIKMLSECGITAVVVDHDVTIWRSIVDKVIYIDNGKAQIFYDVTETPVYQALKDLENELTSLRNSCNRLDKSDEKVLEASDVWFKYPDSNSFVLRGVDVDVYRGEIVWLRGGSGKGKSTLLKILAGILKPSRGYVKRYYDSVQLVPENPLHYISNPTVCEELNWRRDVAELAGLENSFNTPIAFLSSGERRRLAIASAYIRAPTILLIDEPTIGLDPWNAQRVLKLLIDLRSRGTAIVVASHGEELQYISSRVVEV